jgi:hypothetical protein
MKEGKISVSIRAEIVAKACCSRICSLRMLEDDFSFKYALTFSQNQCPPLAKQWKGNEEDLLNHFGELQEKRNRTVPICLGVFLLRLNHYFGQWMHNLGEAEDTAPTICDDNVANLVLQQHILALNKEKKKGEFVLLLVLFTC